MQLWSSRGSIGSGVYGSVFRVWGLGFRVQDLGVLGSVFRVQGVFGCVEKVFFLSDFCWFKFALCGVGGLG